MSSPFAPLRHGLHHGVAEARVDFADFTVLLMRHAPGLRTRPHRHEHAMCCTTLAGAGMQVNDGPRTLRRRGSSGFLAAGERHHDEIGPGGWTQIIVEIQPELLAELDGKPHPLHAGFEVRRGDLYVAALDLVPLLSSRAPADRWRMRSRCYELLAAFAETRSSSDSRPPPWLAQADDFIRDNLADRPTVDRIAAAAGVHPVHLARVFHAYRKTTVAAFVRARVVEEARGALTRTDVPVAAIAAAYGYSAAHFSQMFVKVTGTTPQRLRAERHALGAERML